MLTRGDEYPIHQTPEPIAYSGSDRNFYDRYFFNGYSEDGSVFFAVAFGVYPHLNIADGAVSILKDGVQTSVHVSRVLNMERMELSVGPLSIEIIEPLKRLRVRLAETDGVSLDMTFDGRSFPIEEPRFTYRQGPRMVIDCTRMTQNGRWSGTLGLNGEVMTAEPASWRGTRDRSWGVRPIGAADNQPAAPSRLPQYYWIWTPVNLDAGSLFFHVNDDAEGEPWNTRAVFVPDGETPGPAHHLHDARINVDYESGTRRVASASLSAKDRQGRDLTIGFEPLSAFQMKGIGYSHPEWGHGACKGDTLSVYTETFLPAELNWADPANLHIQALSRVTLKRSDGFNDAGLGTLEQLFVGPHAPSGFKSILDAPE